MGRWAEVLWETFQMNKCLYMHKYLYSSIVLLVSFLSTNVYWIFTSLHIKAVVNYGEEAVLWGLEASMYNLKLYGMRIYLNGMLGFFSVTVVVTTFSLLLTYKSKLYKMVVLLLAINFVGAVTYYLFFVGLKISDYSTSQIVYIYGLDVIREVGVENILGNVIGIWVVMVTTSLLATIAIRR